MQLIKRTEKKLCFLPNYQTGWKKANWEDVHYPENIENKGNFKFSWKKWSNRIKTIHISFDHKDKWAKFTKWKRKISKLDLRKIPLLILKKILKLDSAHLLWFSSIRVIEIASWLALAGCEIFWLHIQFHLKQGNSDWK